MIFSFDEVIRWLITYKYIILFPIAIVEGAVITMIAGFLVSLGYFNFYLAYIVVVLGDIIGDSLHYCVGRFWGNPLVNRFGHHFGLNQIRMQKLSTHFKNHGGKTLIFGKMTHVAVGYFLTAAGMAKMPFWKYNGYALIATLPKSLLLLLIGFYFGKVYILIDRYLKYTALIITLLLILVILIYFIVKYINKKYILTRNF